MCAVTVAFIGLGNMGSAMAARLLGAGHILNVYNRTAARTARLVADGAMSFATPMEACRDADAVISMVADDLASRAVWLGPQGIFAGLAGGALAMECSTLSYEWVLELAGEAARRGIRYVDAPVTGLPATAAAGELTVLAGGNAGDLEDAKELLAPFSRRVMHFGAVGAGTAYKLIVNLLGAVQIASAGESMALAERAGLDLHFVADAIAAGQAASPQVIRNTRRMADDDHAENVVFTPALRLKDVDYALRLARHFGIGVPFGALAGDKFMQLCALASDGEGKMNESRIVDVARREKPDRR